MMKGTDNCHDPAYPPFTDEDGVGASHVPGVLGSDGGDHLFDPLPLLPGEVGDTDDLANKHCK